MIMIYRDYNDINPTIFGGNIFWKISPCNGKMQKKDESFKGYVIVADSLGKELFNKPYQKVDVSYNNGFVKVYLEYSKEIVDAYCAY